MIALVIPPSPFLIDERVFPSLGILKVAASLKRDGYPYEVIDLSGVKNFTEVIRKYANDTSCGTYGITATSPQFPAAVSIARAIKSQSPEAKIIIGGPHVTMSYSAYLKDKMKGVERRGTLAFEQIKHIFDAVVVGDGETAIFEAIEADGLIIDASQLRSDHFLKDGSSHLDLLPDREGIDLGSYHYQIDGRDASSLIAQLGCPFGCKFCGGRNTPSFRAIRTRSLDSILEEVHELVFRYGKRGIMFYDDELNVNPGGLEQLMEMLIQFQMDNNIELSLRGFVKAELFDQHQATLMRAAGFRIILSGIESGSRKMLDIMAKRTTPEINDRLVRLCHENDLKFKALMSIGHAGESAETVADSISWVRKNKVDDVDWTIITQYPGAPYFDESEQVNRDPGVWCYTDGKTGELLFSDGVDYAKELNFYKGIPGNYTSHVWTEHLSPKELVRLRDYAERSTRAFLGLPSMESLAASVRLYEHSMGQSLPDHIVRRAQ